MSILEARNLQFSYRGVGRQILKGINFSVNSGEHIALVGTNGSGKTTLLSLLSGLRAPASGEVLLDGRALGAYSVAERARRIAVLPQSARIPFPYTCFETVLMGLYPFLSRFSPPSERHLECVEDLMRETGTLDFASRNINQLSGGEFQRVIFTRALLQAVFGEGGHLLLLDEPFSELDIASRITMMKLLDAKASAHGFAVIGVHHDLNIACRFAGRVLALKNGELAADGESRKVWTSSFFEDVFRLKVEIVPDKGFLVIDGDL